MLTLRQKVAVLTVVVVAAASIISTWLTVSTERQHIEHQIQARGIALAEALARSVAGDLAAENLDLIRSTQDIVATKDVQLAQVFSSLWLAVASVPVDRLTEPPDPAAVEFFRRHPALDQSLTRPGAGCLDIYRTVVLRPDNPRIRPLLLGYVRLRLSTAQVADLTRRTVLNSIVVAVLLALFAVLVLNVFIGRYVVRPILRLRAAVASHKAGEFPDRVPVEGHDEVAELSSEFNRMVVALREREARLSEEMERLAVTLRSIGDAVVVTDLDARITLFNRAAEQLTGWPAAEAIGETIDRVLPLVSERTREPFERPVRAVLEGLPVVPRPTQALLVRRDGAELVVDDVAAPIRDRESRLVGTVVVARDVTDKRRLELELIKSEKLQSLGLLAGGLAHDFNNLLTAVMGHVSMARLEVGEGSGAYPWLVEAEAAARRATGLTSQLQTFARGGTPVRSTTSVEAIIREAVGFALSGTNVVAELHADHAWPANVDSGQISQVFNNLLLNAVQAMPSGGTVSISVRNCTLGEQQVGRLASGPYLEIAVSDGGIGIPAESLPKIFDPYFTTKPRGSGLGLSSVYSIVARHDGHVEVASEPGHGTTFTIYLPAVPGAVVAARSGRVQAVPGRGRVLVMDDEEPVRKVSAAMLKRLGYDVATASDGHEAVEAYQRARADHQPFDVVVMDLTIPGGMGGREAIGKLLEVDPDVIAVVSSGYSHDPVMADHAAHGFSGVLTKPYTVEGFSRALDAALSRRSRQGGA